MLSPIELICYTLLAATILMWIFSCVAKSNRLADMCLTVSIVFAVTTAVLMLLIGVMDPTPLQ